MVADDEDALADTVAAAWRGTLPHQQFDPDRTLADTGIDSLKAMELVLRIERALARPVPLGLLTPETTARSLTAGLRGGAAPAPTDRPLLFFVMGIGGHQMRMARAWQTWAEEVQFTMIDAPGKTSPDAVLTDLHATAAAMADQITRLQPAGDIRLMGYSFGGAAAYETARALQARGRRISFLGLIDVLPQRGIVERLIRAMMSPSALLRKLRTRLPRIGATRRYHGAPTLLIEAAIRLDARGVASKLARAQAVRDGQDTALADRLEIHHKRALALGKWTPAPTDAPTLLVCSDDGVLTGAPNYWGSRIASLRTVRVKGSHEDLASGRYDPQLVGAFRAALGLHS